MISLTGPMTASWSRSGRVTHSLMSFTNTPGRVVLGYATDRQSTCSIAANVRPRRAVAKPIRVNPGHHRVCEAFCDAVQGCGSPVKRHANCVDTLVCPLAASKTRFPPLNGSPFFYKDTCIGVTDLIQMPLLDTRTVEGPGILRLCLPGQAFGEGWLLRVARYGHEFGGTRSGKSVGVGSLHGDAVPTFQPILAFDRLH